MKSRLRSRRGVVLLDLILGTTLLVIAGVGFVTLLGQHFKTASQLRTREFELMKASEVLERMAGTWSTNDFAASVGNARRGGFDVAVRTVAQNLYDVIVTDTLDGVVLLKTTMYAVDTVNAR
jgi:hypothetical protein